MTTDADRLSTAWQMLGHLGITLADLQATVDRRPSVPTFAEYLPRVAAAASPGTQRTYGTYWHRMAVAWGDQRLDSIVATHIEALQREITAGARVRRTSRGGRHVANCSSPPHAPSTTGHRRRADGSVGQPGASR